MIGKANTRFQVAHFVNLGGTYKVVVSPKGRESFADIRKNDNGYNLKHGQIAFFQTKRDAADALQELT